MWQKKAAENKSNAIAEIYGNKQGIIYSIILYIYVYTFVFYK